MPLKELISLNPKLSVILLSFLVTFIMTFVTKKFTDQNRMRELKGIQKACQIRLKDNKGNTEEIGKINQEMMECSMELMKHSFKPLLITMIPLLIFFWWIRGVFSTTAIAISWIWYYIGTGIISSMILRKIMKVV